MSTTTQRARQSEAEEVFCGQGSLLVPVSVAIDMPGQGATAQSPDPRHMIIATIAASAGNAAVRKAARDLIIPQTLTA